MKRRTLLTGLVGILFSGFSAADAATKKPTPKATVKPKVTKKPTPSPTPKATKVSATPTPQVTPAPQEILVTIEGQGIEVDSLKSPTSLYASVTKGGREYPLLIAKPTERTLKIFTARCPHQGNILNLAQGGEFQCDRHGARFTEDSGKVLAGPTVNNLEQYQPIIKNGLLYIWL
jgi:Rieske Fe-S protein